MTILRAILAGVVVLLACAGTGVAAWWLVTAPALKAEKPTAPALPALVPKILKEDQINAVTIGPDGQAVKGPADAVTLTPKAVDVENLEYGVVERKRVRRSRVYGGEVIVPPGQVVIVSAPLSGTLKAPTGGVPQPGQTLKLGHPVFQLLPLLTPEGRVNVVAAKIDADGQVKTAQSQFDAAQITLERAKRVFQNEAGSRRAVDDAQAQFDLAKKAVEAATARRDHLEMAVGSVEKGTASPLAIESPAAGLLRNVSALAGQNVPSGAALFEVVDLDRVWVRVPVYVADLPAVATDAEAVVTNLAARPGSSGEDARPVTAPPSANPAAGTVDLFYALDNRSARHSPGERVGVALSLKGEAEALTAPWSAVIHDVHGGTWVYEKTGERSFARRRVAVRYVVGDTAILADGPPTGTKIVTSGVAELFGAETGFSK